MELSSSSSSFGEKLRIVRKKHKWSREKVSEQVGVDTRTYSRWEQGRHHPSLRQLRRLCELFETTPDALGFDV